jgi:D-alanyl-D-alanine endopeptidase (penicillin-binding protein 7)
LDRIVRVAAMAVMIGSTMVVAAGGLPWAEIRGAPRAPIGASTANTGPGRAGGPDVRSNMALVIDTAQGVTLYAKHPEKVAPIASITKLMTAMVVLDAQSPLDEAIQVKRADVSPLKHSPSRLPVGARLKRGDLLRVALMASDNRAASALARTYPGGTPACLEAMNRKARQLGMLSTHFTDPTGLSSGNVSSAADLARLVLAASGYPMIREATTSSYHPVRLASGRVLEFHNSNRLVANKTWDIELSKTGYIDEAGRCLVMKAKIAARPVVIILLDSFGKYTRLGDASRIRKWMEETSRSPGSGR